GGTGGSTGYATRHGCLAGHPCLGSLLPCVGKASGRGGDAADRRGLVEVLGSDPDASSDTVPILTGVMQRHDLLERRLGAMGQADSDQDVTQVPTTSIQ